MAFVEQWEKNLRQQLEAGTIKAQAIEPWENDLQNEIKDVTYTPSVVDHTQILAFILVILTFMIVYVFETKTNYIKKWFNSPLIPKIKYYDKDILNLRAELEEIKSNFSEELSNLQNKVAMDAKKISLMGILLNENFVILRDNHDKNRIIMFNRDWTVNKMPQYIKLSQEDIEFLKKNIHQ